MVMHYQVSVPWISCESLHDLISGRYVVIGLDNDESGYPYDFDSAGTFEVFSPAALRRAGRRERSTALPGCAGSAHLFESHLLKKL